jgi:hypothetical protein
MKKFAIGLFCGLLLSLATVVFASNSIQAILFPSKVWFHSNGAVKELDSTVENEVLNYNNKAYIPLRAFAEAMGAAVGYESASSREDGMNKIEILQAKNWKLKRALTPNQMCTGIPVTITVNHDPAADGTTGFVPIGEQSTFHVNLMNYMQDNMIINPVDLKFEVYTMNPNGGFGTLVYSRSLPTISGLVPSQFGYEATINWDQRGLDGDLLSAGKYFINIKRPSDISYIVEGSNEQKSVLIASAMGCNLNNFGTELK